MENNSIKAFLTYYEQTRSTTLKVIGVIPPQYIEWTYKKGKFTIGDLLRHIAAIERYVFAEVAIGKKPAYKGCGIDLAAGYENVIQYFNEMHLQTMNILESLTDDDLKCEITAINGQKTTIGKFLRALVLHEIHHRGALSIYLNLLDVKVPPLLGITEEQVKALSSSYHK